MTESEKPENYLTITAPHEDAPDQWTISAAIIFRDPLSGGYEQNMGGFKGRGFKTKENAQKAALDWAMNEIYKFIKLRPPDSSLH